MLAQCDVIFIFCASGISGPASGGRGEAYKRVPRGGGELFAGSHFVVSGNHPGKSEKDAPATRRALPMPPGPFLRSRARAMSLLCHFSTSSFGALFYPFVIVFVSVFLARIVFVSVLLLLYSPFPPSRIAVGPARAYSYSSTL